MSLQIHRQCRTSHKSGQGTNRENSGENLPALPCKTSRAVGAKRSPAPTEGRVWSPHKRAPQNGCETKQRRERIRQFMFAAALQTKHKNVPTLLDDVSSKLTRCLIGHFTTLYLTLRGSVRTTDAMFHEIFFGKETHSEQKSWKSFRISSKKGTTTKATAGKSSKMLRLNPKDVTSEPKLLHFSSLVFIFH